MWKRYCVSVVAFALAELPSHILCSLASCYWHVGQLNVWDGCLDSPIHAVEIRFAVDVLHVTTIVYIIPLFLPPIPFKSLLNAMAPTVSGGKLTSENKPSERQSC